MEALVLLVGFVLPLGNALILVPGVQSQSLQGESPKNRELGQILTPLGRNRRHQLRNPVAAGRFRMLSPLKVGLNMACAPLSPVMGALPVAAQWPTAGQALGAAADGTP
jgi:hypothetical protein